MAIDLDTYLDRVARTLDHLFADDLKERQVSNTLQFVRDEINQFSEQERRWLPHDTPIDTVLAVLHLDAQTWEKNHAAELDAYDDFVENQGWRLTDLIDTEKAEPAKLRTDSFNVDEFVQKIENFYISYEENDNTPENKEDYIPKIVSKKIENLTIKELKKLHKQINFILSRFMGRAISNEFRYNKSLTEMNEICFDIKSKIKNFEKDKGKEKMKELIDQIKSF